MAFTMVKGFLMSVLLLAVYSNAAVLDQPVDKLAGHEEAGSDSIVQYHLVKGDAELWVVEEIDRGLKVTKVVKSNGEQKCLVEILDVKPESTEHKLKSENVTISETPVEYRSFLSETAAALCEDIPVFWAYKSSDESTGADVGPARRSKRWAGCNDCCNDEQRCGSVSSYWSGCTKMCYWSDGYVSEKYYYHGIRLWRCGSLYYVPRTCGGYM